MFLPAQCGESHLNPIEPCALPLTPPQTLPPDGPVAGPGPLPCPAAEPAIPPNPPAAAADSLVLQNSLFGPLTRTRRRRPRRRLEDLSRRAAV